MSVLLIDDRGRLWDRQSLAARLRRGASLDESELSDFAIMNLGFVGIILAKGRVRIRLRPAVVAPAAVGALYLWLHQHAPERVLITWYAGRWQNELAGWNAAGWRRISALLEQREPYRRRYSRMEIRPDRLPPDNALRHLFEDSAHLTRLAADPARVLPTPLLGRFVVLAEDGSGELRVRDFGRTMMARSPPWQRKARGLRVTDMPDWSYGQWVAEAYRQAARRGQPLLEEVAAVIEWPELGPLLHLYWRLVVPRSVRGEPPQLLGVTLDRAPVAVHRLA